MLGIYLVLKGIEIFQIALASNRPTRGAGLTIGGICIVVCVLAAFYLVNMQDMQAKALSGGNGITP
jgi:hypothetical protein